MNVATFNLAPGYARYDLYCQVAKIDTVDDDLHPVTVDQIAIIEDDDPETVTLDDDDASIGDFSPRNQNKPLSTSTDLSAPRWPRWL
jgi:hypothetical protein